MKPTYGGFEAKKSRGGTYLPPVGQYVAEIQGVRLEKSYSGDRDVIVCMVEITEGEYKGQYHKVFEEQKERWGDDVLYKGTFKLVPYLETDDAWVKHFFESNLFCVQESNGKKADGSYIYNWDWDEKKLVGKKVGINVRENTFIGKKDGKEHTVTEIGQFETVDDVRNGKCQNMKPRGKKKQQQTEDSTSGEEFTGIEFGSDVTGTVEVPF